MAYYWADEWTTGLAYTATQVVFGDGFPYTATMFACIQSHVASASNEPGVGASWEDYWDDTPFSSYQYAGQWLHSEMMYAPGNCVAHPVVTGPVYNCIFPHLTDWDKEPGVGVDWETYWELFIGAGAPTPTTTPWYGFAFNGSLFVTEEMSSGITGTMIVAESEGKLVFRIGAFNEQNDDYDAIEDILSDCGVTFV